MENKIENKKVGVVIKIWFLLYFFVFGGVAGAGEPEVADWWLEELWRIKSVKTNWGYELLILFLVDPQYEGTDKSQAIWAISASEEMPTVMNYNDCHIAQMDLVKGKFSQKLGEFVGLVNSHRNRATL